MATPHDSKNKKYRVFCVKCGRYTVVNGATTARAQVRVHNVLKHDRHNVAAYEPEI